MLTRENTIKIKQELLKKNEDKNLFNEKIFEIYIKEDLYKHNVNVVSCLNIKNITPELLNKIYPYLRNKNQSISYILNLNNFTSKEATDFLIEKSSEGVNEEDTENNFSINEVFDYFHMLDKSRESNKVIQFEEEDLKRLYEHSKKNEIKINRFLSTQKNIDFILKEKNTVTSIREDLIHNITLNKNLSSDFTDKFLSLYINYFNENNITYLMENCNFTKSIIEKYKDKLNLEDLSKNHKLDEELITEYIVKNNNTFKLRTQKVSKLFLKENIKDINYELLFNNLDNEKDCEIFIDLMCKKNVESVEKALTFLNSSKKLDLGFYIKMFEKYGIEKDYGEMVLFYNDNTNEKYLSYIEKFLEEVDGFIDKGILTDYATKAVKHMIKYVNIPEKILTKYIKSLKIDTENKVSYNLLLRHQKLPKNIKLGEFFQKEITSAKVLDICISNQISNKKELDILHSRYINNLPSKEFQSVKNNLSTLLLGNFDYISSLKNNEILKLLKDNRQPNHINFHFLFLLMENNERVMKVSPKQDYGISLC